MIMLIMMTMILMISKDGDASTITSNADHDDWWTSATTFYGAALLVAFILALVTCVCNPKSKRSGGFGSKHRSFMLSHDLPAAAQVPPTNVDHLANTGSAAAAAAVLQTASALVPPSTSSPVANSQPATIAQQTCSVHGQQQQQHHRMGSNSSYCGCGANIPQAQISGGDTVDGCNCKLKANRALPDIPGPGGEANPIQQHQQQQPPFSNSTSTDDVDSLYTVANPPPLGASTANDSNHPYARIRNAGHLPVDSSTENDTDDYSVDGGRGGGGVPPAHPLTSDPSVQYHHHSHPSPSHVGPSFRPSVMVASSSNNPSVEEANAYELEPNQPAHILRLQLRSNNGNSELPTTSTSSAAATDKVEISYNTISVREPLSKVLADNRDASVEHHYNEVEEEGAEEEERLSSFYEEIASGGGGGGGGSSTYSKIAEPVASTSRGAGVAYHRGASSKAATTSSAAAATAAVVANGGPVYSFVDKKSKRSAQAQAQIQPPPSAAAAAEANNLYTMVVKSPAKNGASSLVANSGTSSSDNCKPIALQRYSPPPPLPPPLPHSTQPKSLYRNTIMFGTPSTSAAGVHAHAHNHHSHINHHPSPHHHPSGSGQPQYHHNLADLHDYNTISHDGCLSEEQTTARRSASPPLPPPPHNHHHHHHHHHNHYHQNQHLPNDHLYQKITSKKKKGGSKRPPQPPPPPAHPDPFSPEEKDPGYEVVVDRSEKPLPSAADDNSYGYEAIVLDNSESSSDPAYEIVKQPEMIGAGGGGGSGAAPGDDDYNSPAYETIKCEAAYSRVDELRRPKNGEGEELEEEEDGDPNYEIIVSSHRLQQLQQQLQQPRSNSAQQVHMVNHNFVYHQVHHHQVHHHHQLQQNQQQQLPPPHQSLPISSAAQHNHSHPNHHNHPLHQHQHNHRTHVHHQAGTPNGLLIDENVIIEHL